MNFPVPILSIMGNAAGTMPALRDNDLITVLLILVLGMALGVGFICLLLVLHFMRTGRIQKQRPSLRQDIHEHHGLLGAPTRWVAIRCGNPFLVQAALGLHRPTPVTWEEGLNAAHEHKLFISPAINGWVLVMGTSLPEPSEDIDKCFRFIHDLSRKLGHVQFFSLNRVVGHHAWVQAEHGNVVRAYAWAGKTLWNQGALSHAETQLGMKCYDYTENMERTPFSAFDPATLNTERLPFLAARWSIDPTSIDGKRLKASQGIAGELFRSKAH